MVARLISVCAPPAPRSRKRGCPKMRYFNSATGRSTTQRRLARIHHLPSRGLHLLPPQPLACRTDHRVTGLVIMKLAADEQRTVALIIYATMGRHMRRDPLGFARRCLFSVRVARIGHH